MNPGKNICVGEACDGQHVWDDGAGTVFTWESFYADGMQNNEGDVCIRMMTSGEMQDKECDEVKYFRCVLQCQP